VTAYPTQLQEIEARRALARYDDEASAAPYASISNEAAHMLADALRSILGDDET
jgi:hypothetical protein